MQGKFKKFNILVLGHIKPNMLLSGSAEESVKPHAAASERLHVAYAVRTAANSHRDTIEGTTHPKTIIIVAMKHYHNEPYYLLISAYRIQKGCRGVL